MTAARATIDHETIRRWVETRGGRPARVVGTGRAEGDPAELEDEDVEPRRRSDTRR